MASVEVEKIAFPPARVFVARVVVPSLNVTVPVGTPDVADVTVAVNVTDAPKVEGFSDAVTAVEVPARLTVCVSTDDVPPMKFVVPVYTAVIDREPAETVVVLNFATPLDNPTDPSAVVPSLNVTIPVGAMELVDFTVAVNVTDCPYVDGFRDEVTAEVVVAALFTVCVNTGDVLLPTTGELRRTCEAKMIACAALTCL